VNLKDVEFPEDTTELKASVDTRALTVVVPKGVAVRTHAEVGDGALSILGTDVTGKNVRRDYESEDYGQANRKLSLDLSVGTGGSRWSGKSELRSYRFHSEHPERGTDRGKDFRAERIIEPVVVHVIL
jgi:Cell wall-active antibiotics response 4TMS YvqF